jgi:hypothetical protein
MWYRHSHGFLELHREGTLVVDAKREGNVAERQGTAAEKVAGCEGLHLNDLQLRRRAEEIIEPVYELAEGQLEHGGRTITANFCGNGSE